MASRFAHDVIVIGSSMGGVEALSLLVAHLPAELPACVCVVLHTLAEHRSLLPQILSRAGPLPALHPRDGEPLRHGHIYVAPSDYHLMLERDRVRVIRGPLENGHRPAVDTLFRSAARAYGARVVGVILSGSRNDGTAGLATVKALGGVAVVQDPQEALCGDMPRSALEYVAVDYTARLAEIAALLGRLSTTSVKTPRKRPAPRGLKQEIALMKGRPKATNQAPQEGNPSYFSCPDCGGVLFEMEEGAGLLRYRCRVGHAFTGEVLLDGQGNGVESALWAAIRALEETAALARRLARRAQERKHSLSARHYEERALMAEQQAQAIRQVTMEAPPPEPPHGRSHRGSRKGPSPER